MILYELAGADPDRRFSPYCWRARMALAHKGLAVERVPWRLTDKDAIAFSGQGSVPVLRDGERVISDSWRIAEYLEESYPERPSLFGGSNGRGHARFVDAWYERTLRLALFPIVVLDIVATLAPEDRDYYRTTREQRFGTSLEAFAGDRSSRLQSLVPVLAPLRDALSFQPFLGGTSADYTDYIVFSGFQWARVTSPVVLLAADDPVHAWRERMLSLFDGLAR